MGDLQFNNVFGKKVHTMFISVELRGILVVEDKKKELIDMFSWFLLIRNYGFNCFYIKILNII